MAYLSELKLQFVHPGSNAEPIRSLAVCQRTRRLVAKPSHLRQLEGQSCLQGQQPGPVHAQLYRSERRCRDSGLRPFSLAYPSRLTRGRWATCRNPVWAASIVPRGQLERARELGWGGPFKQGFKDCGVLYTQTKAIRCSAAEPRLHDTWKLLC